ncbi:MAG: permease-like cell division protein FtsX [Bacteroidales bacterium]|nr:permease-like cell division protein FtsX [Bacteroidales bacterium]
MARGENKMIRRRLANAYLSSVVSISLVLLLVGVASLLLVNTDSVSDYFKENMKVSVLMMPEVSDQQAMDYQAVLDSMPFIRGTEFISRARGEEEMAQMLGKDFLSVFETSPIPVSVDVTLDAAYVSEDSLQVVSRTIAASPLVDEVVYQKSLVDALSTNLARISLVLGVFIALLLFISFVLISNTMRLNVYARRFTIHTMKLVGATRSFIRGPFLVNSALLGLFSALVAILMLVGLLYVLRSQFSQLFELFRLDLLLVAMGIVVVSGVVICVVSTYFVVGHLIRLDKSELYY